MRNGFQRRSLLSALTVLACLNVSAEHASIPIEVSGPITNGSMGGPFAAPVMDVSARGYVVEEFFLSGKAGTYRMVDGADQTSDGRWRTELETQSQPYKTRILVVRPKSDGDFNGTVIVHWQNVTAGYELGTVTDGEYLRGYAWVGVSAQRIGIDGFPGPDAAGLKQWDEQRYRTLTHPGDAYSFDIFSQAGRVVGPDRAQSERDPMGGLNVRRLVAAGASQSASRLRTYINGVHPHAQVFHGFMPYIDFASPINFAADKLGERRRGRPTSRIRDDLVVPVFVVNSETETQAYLPARQPDTGLFRFWEVAGTSHVSVPRSGAADTVGLNAPNWLSYTPVYDAAMRHMHHWLTKGVPPPRMPLIETVLAHNGEATIKRDQYGNAVGGIRLPEMVVPTAVHNGVGQPVEGGNRFAFLYGSAHDFSAAELNALYANRKAYLTRYDAALNDAVDSGVMLAEDRPKLQAANATWAKQWPLHVHKEVRLQSYKY